MASRNIARVDITTLVIILQQIAQSTREPRIVEAVKTTFSIKTRSLLVAFTRPTTVPVPSCRGPTAILGTKVMVGSWKTDTVTSIIKSNLTNMTKVPGPRVATEVMQVRWIGEMQPAQLGPAIAPLPLLTR